MSSSRTNNNAISAFDDVKGLSRDRPWLLPSNRRLRHLQGVSVRNLALCQPLLRARGKTIDDESLPHALKTPAKVLAQRENPRLEHSRSSDDLKSSAAKLYGLARTEDSKDEVPLKIRPSSSGLRRRSTLNWTNAPPRVRQTKLEDVARDRMADTWFSIHCSTTQEPIYVSEVIEKAMNPSFRFFDLNVYGPKVTRLDELTIRYWAKTENMESYILLVEVQLCLRSLQFTGKTLESFHHPLPQNCVLLHLSDGIYTSFTDLPLDEAVLTAAKPPTKPQARQPTSSFNALMRLSNLDDCIQDALSTREKLTSQITKLLEEQKQSINTINAASEAEQSLASTNRAVMTSRKLLKAAKAQRTELLASLEARRAAIASGRLAQQKAQSHLASDQANLESRRTLLRTIRSDLSGQLCRIFEDILCIYPIEPFEQKPLSFTIRGLNLPNAASISTTDADPPTTAAALGHVAHVIHLLSLYLSIPVPYPPTPHGSTSTILDPISTNMPSLAARIFPLYQKGAVVYRFEYGAFLLNSDIELLMSRQGSRMVDLRHTLPNLKYLLTVLTTGHGELPLRKKGISRAMRNGRAAEERPSKTEEIEKGRHANGKLPAMRL